ncbi:MAG: type I glutamate--ammonia ligase [Holosporales bacterium]|jgi:glutamine synthetase
MSKDVAAFLSRIQDEGIEYIDFRFTDMRGKWHHTAQHVSTIDEDLIADGIMFDGSSIAGWKAINESDMILKPDLSTVVRDLYSAAPQLIVVCDVLEPATGQGYSRDPRTIARKAEAHLVASGIADTAYFGPEAEFFIFDNVRFRAGQTESFFHLDSYEFPQNNGKEYNEPQVNQGHRPGPKGGYFPVNPVDSVADIRAEMLSNLAEVGVEVEKHHHEVAPAQHELGIKFSTMLKIADAMQMYKYVVHNVAAGWNKTATFMPKPIYGDNGSGMHVHQSLWKGNKPLFAGNGYADLSETALFYIGGIIRHAKAINALTNPSTNSYKRLVPGYEAPVLLAYSSRNRSASCRIPYVASPKGKRVEVRFPDPSANPYLAYAAMLMAGLDGIQNKIHPGEAMDKNLYDLPPEELKNVPTVCGSLREALDNLDKDRAFLKKGHVFSDDFIDAYIELKMEEVRRFEMTPHPVEFELYYSV